MKKYLFLSVTLLLAALTSCGLTESVTGYDMDAESAYNKAAELIQDVDPAWKVYRFSVSAEGMSDQCSNTLGYVNVGYMNADGDAYTQVLYPIKGKPDTDSFAPKGVGFDELPAPDFTAEKAMKNINDCKAMIPEGFSFLNLQGYDVKYKPEFKGFVTEIEIHIQEVGKESIDVNGSKSGVYYQLNFTITPDGKIEMKEG